MKEPLWACPTCGTEQFKNAEDLIADLHRNKSVARCPVCDGAGTLMVDADLTVPLTKPCHGCNGKGWVAV
jgi:DnaJ-class molecular chaperone